MLAARKKDEDNTEQERYADEITEADNIHDVSNFAGFHSLESALLKVCTNLYGQKYKIVSVSWIDSQIAELTWCYVDEIQFKSGKG